MKSNQPGVHPGLAERVQRHLDNPWRQPLHAPSVAAFEQLDALRRTAGAGRDIVLDAGCGTGESSRALAAMHPDALVVGVDRSAARLARVGADRAPQREGRVLWARMDLPTFWRLALDAGWPVAHHYLLYPNPWPKAAHLARRWHGHPVFPTLLALGGQLELRSNWSIYMEEFCEAVAFVTRRATSVQALTVQDPVLSPFEQKYASSGHSLWRLLIKLPDTSIHIAK